MRTIQLNAEIPEFTTYQYIACPAIVVSENSTAENWYFNNSLQVRCNKELNEANNYELELTFFNAGYCKMKDIIDYHTLPRNLFISNFHEMIYYCLEHGYYAYIDCYDEYYLENSRVYNTAHITHDCLITGYDTVTDRYKIAVYNMKEHFNFIESSRTCLKKALFSEYLIKDPIREKSGYLCAMRAKKINCQLDLNSVKNGISDYLSGTPEINDNPECQIAVGIGTVRYCLKYIDSVANYNSNLDLRFTLFYYEYRKFILKLIKKLEAYLNWNNNLSNIYSAVAERAYLVHYMCLKLNLTKNFIYIKKIKKLIKDNLDMEYKILNEIRNRI